MQKLGEGVKRAQKRYFGQLARNRAMPDCQVYTRQQRRAEKRARLKAELSDVKRRARNPVLVTMADILEMQAV